MKSIKNDAFFHFLTKIQNKKLCPSFMNLSHIKCKASDGTEFLYRTIILFSFKISTVKNYRYFGLVFTKWSYKLVKNILDKICKKVGQNP